MTYSSSSLVFSFNFLLDLTGLCFMRHLGVGISRELKTLCFRTWKGSLTTFQVLLFFKELFGSFCPFSDHFLMRKILFRSMGNGIIPRDTCKLFRKFGMIWVDRQIFLKMFQGMMLPSRSTVPSHLRIIFQNYYIDRQEKC